MIEEALTSEQVKFYCKNCWKQYIISTITKGYSSAQMQSYVTSYHGEFDSCAKPDCRLVPLAVQQRNKQKK